MEVEFRDVSVALGGRTILDRVSLRIEAGETLALLGASGSGKTTALRLVNKMLVPDMGKVLVGGKPTTGWDAIALRRNTGYVIQESGLFPHMTVAENVGVVPKLSGWSRDRIATRVEALLNEVQLPALEFRHRYPHELSGGQRQRVGVARALAAEPGLLLLDEPFGALDPLTRLELQKQFIELRTHHRKTAMLVTHDVAEALRLGTQVGLLEQGRLVALASSEKFRSLDHPTVRQFMGCLEA